MFVSLGALYFCSLQSVNILDAGYSMLRASLWHIPPTQSLTHALVCTTVAFFVIFISSEQLAKKLWVLLIIYTEFVICLLMAYQVSWTCSWDTNEWIEVIGLRHFDTCGTMSGVQLIFGLKWHLLILIMTSLQFLLYRSVPSGLVTRTTPCL